jgi:hypothetical protein
VDFGFVDSDMEDADNEDDEEYDVDFGYVDNVDSDAEDDEENEVFIDYEDGLSVAYDEELDDVETFTMYENDVAVDTKYM